MRKLERSIFLMSTRNDCTVGADTTASGSEFQMRTTRHEKNGFECCIWQVGSRDEMSDLLKTNWLMG